MRPPKDSDWRSCATQFGPPGCRRSTGREEIFTGETDSLRAPERAQIDIPLQEQLIVELYSK